MLYHRAEANRKEKTIVSRSIIRDTARSATRARKTYERSNPLLMRKKMEVKDVYFRKNEPDREMLRFELAFDFEQYFIVAAGVIILLILLYKMAKWAKKRELKRAERARLKRKMN